jgi:hypothetical protein
LIAVLIGGGNHLIFFEQRFDGTDVIKADDEDFANFAGGLDSGDGAEGHAVVGAKQGFEVGVFAKDGGGDVVGLFHFPVAALDGDDVNVCGFHGVFKSGAALLAVEGGGDAFDDGNFVAGLESFSEGLAYLASAFAIVGADEGDFEASLLKDFGVEFIIDVYDEDAGVFGAFENGDEGLGIGRGNDNGVDLASDHLFDEVHLLGEVGFIFNAVDDQIVFAGIGLLMFFCAIGHGAEEFVGERFHDERHFRFCGGSRGGLLV